ncbi:hypothetical protein PWT90_03592 [Aphanocladium album]|nr:hypothetical protein PWT90_03592 [Aphanocladium album]
MSSSPPASRMQTGVACEECRRRKSKCDRIRPRCGACEDMSTTCVFPEKRLQRGPKKGQMNALRTRVATLERQLRLERQQEKSDSQAVGSATGDDVGVSSIENLLGTDLFMDMRGSSQLPPLHFNSPNSGRVDNFMTGGEFYRDWADPARMYPVAPIIHRRLYTAWQGSPGIHPSQTALQHAMWAVAAAVSTQFRHVADTLAAEARNTLDALCSPAETPPPLETMQSWLMLAHYDALCKSEHEAAITAGRAIRLVQLAKLHDVDAEDITTQGFGSSGVSTPVSLAGAWEEKNCFARLEEKRRTFWLAYWVDRFWLMRSDWPLSIQDDLIYTRLPAPEANFQSSQPVAMDFLSTALTSSGTASLPPFAECIVLDFLFGRCIVHQRLAPSAAFLTGDKSREFWRMHAWLTSTCEKRNGTLTASYTRDADCAADPMFVFAYSFAKFMKMYLATSHAASAIWGGGLDGGGDGGLAQSVNDLAAMAKTMPRFGSFKAHPFLPSLLYRAALIVTKHSKSQVRNHMIDEALNAALNAITAVLKNLQEVSNLARVLLLELEQQLAML